MVSSPSEIELAHRDPLAIPEGAYEVIASGFSTSVWVIELFLEGCRHHSSRRETRRCEGRLKHGEQALVFCSALPVPERRSSGRAPSRQARQVEAESRGASDELVDR
jgi:hypothetical protein